MMCAQARGVLGGLLKPGALAYTTLSTAPYRLWPTASLRQDKNVKTSHHGPYLAQKARFSTSKQQSSKSLLPPPDSRKIKETKIIWHHPIYSEKDMRDICVAHRDARCMSDKVALSLVQLLRWGTDFATGYRNPKKDEEVAKRFVMDERKWLIRFIFLESVAGVPGMVGGMLRHLKSIRQMKRDHGWIESLIEEAYNERMHLLTFMKLAEPGPFMRLMVLGAQGVFFNLFFLSYLISPRTCHRFVGYLEEEAVITYTHAIHDVEAGKLPLWNNLAAPDIAVKYWEMPEGKRRMVDLLLYVRADEAKHREVNHTLGNLDQKKDPNPYTAEYHDPSQPRPIDGPDPNRAYGWERKDVI
ncbi:alternative oxidase [Penicillium soppii]|uniref:alternative oxidase n=1 Tax=Penicillium soppii TaxID=69789 RepID=UPI002548BDF6|nr:alternative oxidase [Penicillium soppii]KAJ5860080.1 alternative oxidase [Penicillium soppii]